MYYNKYYDVNFLIFKYRENKGIYHHIVNVVFLKLKIVKSVSYGHTLRHHLVSNNDSNKVVTNPWTFFSLVSDLLYNSYPVFIDLANLVQGLTEP